MATSHLCRTFTLSEAAKKSQLDSLSADIALRNNEPLQFRSGSALMLADFCPQLLHVGALVKVRSKLDGKG